MQGRENHMRCQLPSKKFAKTHRVRHCEGVNRHFSAKAVHQIGKREVSAYATDANDCSQPGGLVHVNVKGEWRLLWGEQLWQHGRQPAQGDAMAEGYESGYKNIQIST